MAQRLFWSRNMFEISIFLTLLILGFLFGRAAERKHFKSIIKREEQYRNILTFSKRFPDEVLIQTTGELVGGNVVVANDYFKSVLASLKGLVGGRLTAYESLLERARREAILRMKEQAYLKGMDTIINVKLETSSITKGQKDQVGCVEVYAYGTGLASLKPAAQQE